MTKRGDEDRAGGRADADAGAGAGADADADADATPMLVVRVERAEGLRAMDRGGTSDPFCTLRCAGQTRRTAVKQRTLEPQWEEEHTFIVTSSAIQGALELTCWDKDLLSADDFMGKLHLPLAEMPVGQAQEGWFELTSKAGKQETHGRSYGRVWLSLTLHGTGASAAAGAVGSGGGGGGGSSPQSAAARATAELIKLQKEGRVPMLRVRLLRASGLLAMDRGGTSDPFATLECSGVSSSAATKHVQRSTVQPKTLDPEWGSPAGAGEEFSFALDDDPRAAMLKLTMYDKDLMTTDFLGQVTLPVGLDHIKPGVAATVRHELCDKDGAQAKQSRGSVEVELLLEAPDEYLRALAASGATASRRTTLLSLLSIFNLKMHELEAPDGSLQLLGPEPAASCSIKDTKFASMCIKSDAEAAAAGVDEMRVFTQKHLLRTYPSGVRSLTESANPDPIPMWCAGTQVAALNCQTHGRSMWLNHGRFVQNGGCGWVLKPPALLPPPSGGAEPEPEPESRLELSLSVLSGHCLSTPADSMTEEGMKHLDSNSLFRVRIEVAGDPADSRAYATGRAEGPIPDWSSETESAPLTVTLTHPSLALVLIVVEHAHADSPKSWHFAGFASFPALLVRPGYRMVPLHRSDGSALEQAYLFVHTRAAQTGGKASRLLG